MDPLRFRLNYIDHYQSQRTHFDPQLPLHHVASQQNDAPRVPVLRVFGATETGQKICAHIHGAHPYLYIEYHGSLIPEDVAAYIHRLQHSIDHALGISYRRTRDDGKHGQARFRFVAHISLVKGVPFYGFYVGYRFYLKIYTLNPMHTTRFADLLRQGVIMKTRFQPYESHIQFISQFMIDYNLNGCAYLECGAYRFRTPVPECDEIHGSLHKWHSKSIPRQLLSDEFQIPKQSHCAVEVDICVQDILNRRDVTQRLIHHDFVERGNPELAKAKLVNSMADLWRDEARRRRILKGESDNSANPFPSDAIVSLSAERRETQSTEWVHELEYMECIRAIIADEKTVDDSEKVEFDSFIKKIPFESLIKTALDSVQELYPENVCLDSFGSQVETSLSQLSNDIDWDVIEVDEGKASLLAEEFGYPSDEEIAKETMMSQPFRSSPAKTRFETPRRKRFADLGVLRADLDSPTSSAGRSSPFQTPTKRNPIKRDLDRLSTGLDVSTYDRTQLHAMGMDRVDNLTITETDAEELETPKDLKYLSGSQEESNRKRKEFAVNGYSEHAKRLKLSNGTASNRQTESYEKQSDEFSVNVPTVRAASEPYISRPGEVQQPKVPSSENSGVRYLESKISHASTSLQQPNESTSAFQKSVGSSRRRKHVSFVESELHDKPSKTNGQIGLSVLGRAKNWPWHLRQVAKRLSISLRKAKKTRTVMYNVPPPSRLNITSSLHNFVEDEVIHQAAYYSQNTDIPTKAREYAGRGFQFEGKSAEFLPAFDPTGALIDSSRKPNIRIAVELSRIKQIECMVRKWEIAAVPPTYQQVRYWLKRERKVAASEQRKSMQRTAQARQRKDKILQNNGPMQKRKHTFKFSQKQKDVTLIHDAQYMSVMSLETHVSSRDELLPNPDFDEVQCIFWCVYGEDDKVEGNGAADGTHVGILILSPDGGLREKLSRFTNVDIREEPTELDLLTSLVDVVRFYDTDVLTGYEIHNSSWGYIIERARKRYDLDLCEELSRTKTDSHGRFSKNSDRWDLTTTSTVKITGRHTVNIWRAMRSEMNLSQYTMENVAYILLRRRIPHYAHSDLTKWYTSSIPREFARVIQYYTARVQLDLEILDEQELIPRHSEQARVLGVDYSAVAGRGSQLKVESCMFRIAKPENYMLPSPSRKQVGGQNALECLPLVMEPQSNFFPGPVLVLDFQSLYPSIMIAYNLCYSTFLGRVVSWRGTNKMGFTEYKRLPRALELLEDYINVLPNGMVYVKPVIRKSLLAKMLVEILETRVMMKSGMKIDKENRILQRLLNNRQLALKLLANVTYGYTSASFSGRMPCSEIADSIVQAARETLERAIAKIHAVKRWNAEVVYGDTDSLFVSLKGRSKDEAFSIGNDIVKEITKLNPKPVKLKFEKVYFPCVLLAKKRYVGYKYEHKDQQKPEFDAKGIETIRRDGTPGEQKIEEAALKILFHTADLSKVKRYFQQQCQWLMQGRTSIPDFLFAKEVKLGSYSENGLPPPGARLAVMRMQADPRAEPEYGERIPYLVIAGAPGSRLIDRCVDPEVLLHDQQKELDAEYYITKNWIPPLERIFNLVGADIRSWYEDMPKVRRLRRIKKRLEKALAEDGTEAGTKTEDTEIGTKTEDIEADIKVNVTEGIAKSDITKVIVKLEDTEADGQAGNQLPVPEAVDRDGIAMNAAEVTNDVAINTEAMITDSEDTDFEETESEETESDDTDAKTEASDAKDDEQAKETLEAYLRASNCVSCGRRLRSKVAICKKCSRNRTTSLLSVQARLKQEEGKLLALNKVCRSCSGLAFGEEVKCDSRDCAIYYARTRQTSKMRFEDLRAGPVIERLERLGHAEFGW